MAAVIFLVMLVIAAVHWGGGTLLGHHYLDAELTLLAAGLLVWALGWTGLPAPPVRR